MRRIIEETLGHYLIQEKIGSGGMGEVYRARDTRLNRTVAVKVLALDLAKRPEMRRRFERECRAVAALSHPNIVTIHSVAEQDEILFFSMELIEGKNLSDSIPAGGFLMPRFLELAIPLVDAVSFAHSKGITHRDLKPGNIMLEREGGLKVLDFGLARIEEQEEGASDYLQTISLDRTAEGTILGTVSCMSPEQLRGESADHRSDIFAIGIILYEMLTGRHPFNGETPADLISSILRDKPPQVSEIRLDLPRRLAQVIDRCLEKDPSFRLQSALALRNDLEEIKRHTEAGQDESITSIAVLTPEDLSADQAQGYFCEGLAEELVDDLSKIRNLRVASRTHSSLIHRTTADVRTIGRELNVQAIVSGSVRKEGEKLRITAELLQAATGFLLWSEHYDRQLEDVFAIQDEIAQKIAEALNLTLTAGEMRSIQTLTTSDVRAYDYYLRGRRFFYQYRRKGMELALQMFEMATRHDANYALAFSGISDCYCFLYLYADRSQASLDKANQASRRALELNPDLAEAHTSCGQVLSLRGRHQEAEAEFETAARLRPKLFEAHYLYARDCFARGVLEKAAHLFELAASVRPEDYQSLLLVAQVYERLNRLDDAQAARIRGVRIVEERLQLQPDDVRALYMGANGLVALGERDRALEWATLALDMEPDEPMVLYNVACIFSLAGKTERAIDLLERSVHLGLRQAGWIQNDSNLDPLRAHPRFAALMSELEQG